MDPHTAPTAPAAGAPRRATPVPGDRRDTAVRAVLWVLLLLAAAGNVVTSSLGALALSIPFGLVVLGLAAALVVHHRRTRA